MGLRQAEKGARELEGPGRGTPGGSHVTGEYKGSLPGSDWWLVTRDV